MLLIVLPALILIFRVIDCCVSVDGWFRFAGPMERYQAEEELQEWDNGTFLIRHRSKECTGYAISIK